MTSTETCSDYTYCYIIFLHPLLTIRSWSILTSYSIIFRQCRLISQPSSSCNCLSIIYSCYFRLAIDGARRFQLTTPAPMAMVLTDWFSLDWLVKLYLLLCDISILAGATCMCVSTQSNFLCARIGILLVDLLNYWINHARLIQSWSWWWYQLQILLTDWFSSSYRETWGA